MRKLCERQSSHFGCFHRNEWDFISMAVSRCNYNILASDTISRGYVRSQKMTALFWWKYEDFHIKCLNSGLYLRSAYKLSKKYEDFNPILSYCRETLLNGVYIFVQYSSRLNIIGGYGSKSWFRAELWRMCLEQQMEKKVKLILHYEQVLLVIWWTHRGRWHAFILLFF